MDERQSVLTHYYPEIPKADKWLKLNFITYDIYLGDHYLGNQRTTRLHSESLEKLIELGLIYRFPKATKIDIEEKKILYLTPSFTIYLASKHNPISDPDKIIIMKADEYRKVIGF